MRGNMQRRGRAQTCPKNNCRAISRSSFHGVVGSECGRSQPGEPRRSRAAAEARVIHPPNLDRPVVPHFRFGCDPPIRAIGVAVESQHVNLRLPALLSQFGRSRPNFQFAALKWNRLSNRRAGINPVCGREQNQGV